MNQDSYRFRLGDLMCTVLRDAPTTSMKNPFIGTGGRAPIQTAEDTGRPPTEVDLDFNCLFVRSDSECVLVDAGWGTCTERQQGALLANLSRAGVSPRTISLVVITHHDRDHLAGIVDPQGALAYPNARYVMTDEGWAWYTSEANLVPMPAPEAAFHRMVYPLLRGQVTLVHRETKISPGIRIIPAPGHRPGHVVVELSSSGERLLHLADTMLNPLFVESPEWGKGYDNAPAEALATRRELLARAAKEGVLVFLPHFPFPGLGYIRESGDTWRWQPIGETSKT